MDRYYNVPDEASKQWKKFGMDTEAGRMLNKLYAGKNKVQINYPRINTVSRKENMAQPRFIPAGGKKDVNPRSNRIMKVNVNRPKVGRGKKPKKIHAIDVIRRRKSKASIDEVNKTREFDVKGFQGPATKAVSTEQNKRMLQMTNQFKGGKILPNAGSYDAISTQIPLHVITGSDKARAFHEKTMAKRRGLTTNQPKVKKQSEKTEIEKLREDFDFAMNLIAEDENFLNELENDNSKEAKKARQHVMNQTAEHLRRARDIDKKMREYSELNPDDV